jgi:ABC-type multidrug transport system ATPase subunit
MIMIVLKKLSKQFGSGAKAIRALNEIDLEIGEGMFGLLGPNGAGKTTLMRILAGVALASSGEAIVGGFNLHSEKDREHMKAMLGYLPQELGMYPELTARQFIDYMAILKGMNDPQQRNKSVSRAIEMVGLAQAADRKVKGFSGGMKRRVGIAQALVNDPRILIVDEPTAGLDPEERIRFRNLLVDLAEHRVVILSTHIVEDIGQTCRDMAVLSKGQMLFRGSPLDLTGAAQGHVWTILSDAAHKPDHGLTIVSMLHLAEGVQYRVVGASVSDYPQAVETRPGLEDGYVWLMKSIGQEVDSGVE